MIDLIEFLDARLDEDEAAAKGALQELSTCGGIRVSDPGDGGNIGHMVAYQFHARRHDPARVLREVAVKRALMQIHQPVPFWGNNPPPRKDCTLENAVAWYCECQCPDGVILGTYPCDVARLLASVWSDNPGYRTEWHH